MQKDANYYIEILLSYYGLSSLQELAHKLDVKQPSISSWKARNSVSAIKKKCRELGIYNEIFKDSSISITQGNDSRAAGRDYREGSKTSESQRPQLDELTMSLIKKLVDKIGEDELQFKLMELIKNG